MKASPQANYAAEKESIKILQKVCFLYKNTFTFDINLGLFSFYIRHAAVKYILIT